jgi:4a-hydroxytetrahydrobiopterin dehydratase
MCLSRRPASTGAALPRSVRAIHNGIVTERLDDGEIAQWLRSRTGWERRGEEIRKRFERASFADAISFVVRIGFLAEAANHHPDIDIRWRTVAVALTTHDSGGLTRRDLDVATSIDEAAG